MNGVESLKRKFTRPNLAKASLWIFFGLLAYMPLHIFLSTWFGTTFRLLEFAKIAKDLVLIVGFVLVLISALDRRWLTSLKQDKLAWFVGLYALLTLVMAIFIPNDQDAEIEVRNYKKALDYIDKRKVSGKPIELKDILTIHELIMEGLLPPEKTGVLRTVGVDIIDQDDTVLYKGPKTAILEEEITALLDWLKESENIHPVIAAAILHFQLVSIHPFSDGNGRTTRVLTQLYLGLRDYDFRGTLVLDSYYYTDKRAYYDALHTVQGENYQIAATAVLDPWISYFVDGFLSSAKVLSVEVMILSNVIVGDKPVKRINSEDADLLSYAKQFGSISLAEAESVLPNVPRRTLQRKLKTLVDNGYLTVSGSTRSTVYVWAKK